MILDRDRPDFEALCAILRDRVGKERAITKSAIARTLGWPRRKVEHCLEIWRGDFPFLVCACSAGVYLANDADDLTHEYRRRRSYIRAIAATWRALRREAIRRGFRWRGDLFDPPPPRSEFLFPLDEIFPEKNS